MADGRGIQLSLPPAEEVGQILLSVAFFSWLMSALLGTNMINILALQFKIPYDPARVESILAVIMLFMTVYASTIWKSQGNLFNSS